MSEYDFASPYDMPSVETPADENAREHRWWAFETECREFAAAEPDGYAAVLRAVARAMKDAPEAPDA